jgi:branched-subunit amino acid aminotransferase/4-amino-4-deoxychorismate lyase
VFIACGELDPRLAKQQRRGVAIVRVDLARGSWLAEHKSANYLEGVVAKIAAAQRDADEAIFVAGGRLREGTTSNLFALHGDVLSTPTRRGILAGVTRGLVLELARRAGWRVRQREMRATELDQADEVFLTSSLAEILPVRSVDGRRVGNGRPGERTRRLQGWYRELVAASVAPAPCR